MTTCERWADEMRTYIERKEWLKLTPAPCHTQKTCPTCGDWLCAHPLSYFMNGYTWYRPRYNYEPSGEWTAAEAVERLYGRSLTSKDWYDLILEYAPPHTVLRYLFARNHIHPTDADPITYLAFYTSCHQYDTLDYLATEARLDFNLQNALSGNTPLLVFMLNVFEDRGCEESAYQVMTPAEYRDYLQAAVRRIHWYLECGTDPLLENREGVSPWSLTLSLESHPHVPEDIRRELYHLLKRY